MKRYLIALPTLLLLATMNPAQAWWWSEDTYTETRYPVVLTHGMFGFDSLAGVEYWYRIPQELERSGADVHVTQVSSLNSTEARGEQLARQVEEILATTGADKVNLIGHSHGAPTIRYVASVYPDYVASATSVGGANRGSRVADAVKGVTDNSDVAAKTVETLGNALGNLIALLSGSDQEQDVMASLSDLTTGALQNFNQQYPEGMPARACDNGPRYGSNGVQYFSWSGTQPLTNVADASDALLGSTSLIFTDQASDGLVGRCSSHLGQVIRDDYRMNHLDEVNQLFGLHHLWATDPTSIYRQHANRLKNSGL
jgi:triacylglycerol lipase